MKVPHTFPESKYFLYNFLVYSLVEEEIPQHYWRSGWQNHFRSDWTTAGPVQLTSAAEIALPATEASNSRSPVSGTMEIDSANIIKIITQQREGRRSSDDDNDVIRGQNCDKLL